METQVIDPATMAAAAEAYNLSIWGLFVRADLVVKTVILALMLASFWSWAIIFDKVNHMFYDQYGQSVISDFFYQLGGFSDFIGSKPGHDFVQQSNVGCRSQGPRQFKPFLIGKGQGMSESIFFIKHAQKVKDIESKT